MFLLVLFCVFDAAKAPQGWLQFHESAGGHTIARHVGGTDAELLARIQNSPRISGTSTFLDQTMAESVISATIGANRVILNAWL